MMSHTQKMHGGMVINPLTGSYIPSEYGIDRLDDHTLSTKYHPPHYMIGYITGITIMCDRLYGIDHIPIIPYYVLTLTHISG